jgi:DNA polymerase I-like protein with 3'-5' exonuclease and polymerase domains
MLKEMLNQLLKLWHRMKVELSDQDLWTIFETETRLFPCLVDMRFKGVRVDVEKADKIKKELMDKENKIINKIKDLTGVSVELWAASSIAKVFDALKLPYDRTEKTGAFMQT